MVIQLLQKPPEWEGQGWDCVFLIKNYTNTHTHTHTHTYIEEGNGNHASVLAWRIPWTEEPGRLQPMGLQESDTT